MSREWTPADRGGSEEERDTLVASGLRAFDPAATDPHFWLRFQTRVLRDAAPELARRRLMADLTVADVLAGWARAVVPTAVAASLVAGFLLMRAAQSHDDFAATQSVEELLVVGLGEETIPVALVNGEAAASVAFAAERF